MKEKNLLRISMIIAVVGVTLLYFISGTIKIEEKDIDKINNADEDVKLTGEVARINERENAVFMEIEKPGKITVIVFRKRNESTGINQGDKIEVIGRTDEYDGKMQIIANRVRVIP